jgi:hypothetical protein
MVGGTAMSDVAQLRLQIDREYEAAYQGLYGLASGAARHQFIHCKMERIACYYQELATRIGEDAADEMLCMLNEQYYRRWKQSAHH